MPTYEYELTEAPFKKGKANTNLPLAITEILDAALIEGSVVINDVFVRIDTETALSPAEQLDIETALFSHNYLAAKGTYTDRRNYLIAYLAPYDDPIGTPYGGSTLDLIRAQREYDEYFTADPNSPF